MHVHVHVCPDYTTDINSIPLTCVIMRATLVMYRNYSIKKEVATLVLRIVTELYTLVATHDDVSG